MPAHARTHHFPGQGEVRGNPRPGGVCVLLALNRPKTSLASTTAKSVLRSTNKKRQQECRPNPESTLKTLRNPSGVFTFFCAAGWQMLLAC